MRALLLIPLILLTACGVTVQYRLNGAQGQLHCVGSVVVNQAPDGTVFVTCPSL